MIFARKWLTLAICGILLAGATIVLAGCQAIHVPYDPFDPNDPNRPGLVTDQSAMTGGWRGGFGHR